MLLSIQRFVSFYKGKGDKSRIKGIIIFRAVVVNQ